MKYLGLIRITRDGLTAGLTSLANWLSVAYNPYSLMVEHLYNTREAVRFWHGVLKSIRFSLSNILLQMRRVICASRLPF